MAILMTELSVEQLQLIKDTITPFFGDENYEKGLERFKEYIDSLKVHDETSYQEIYEVLLLLFNKSDDEIYITLKDMLESGFKGIPADLLKNAQPQHYAQFYKRLVNATFEG